MKDVRAGKLSIEEIGKKHGVKPATIRTWKRRDKSAADPNAGEEHLSNRDARGDNNETTAFAMDATQLPADQMPDFGPADALAPGDQAQPAAAPSTPPPAAPTAPADAIMWKELVALASTGFDKTVQQMIGQQEGKPADPKPPEPISKEDQAKLAEAIHAAFVAYGGNLAAFLAKWGPLINLTVVTGAIFLPRIFEARDYIKHRKQLDADEKAARARIAAQPAPSPLAAAIRHDEPETSIGDQLVRRYSAPVQA
jgi:hypothetical protein